MSEPLQTSLDAAATLLGYSKRTIQRMIDNGDLTATGAGRLRRVDMQSIIDKQARMRQGEPPLCEKRKPVPTGKASRATRTDAAALSDQSRSATTPVATKTKLSLLPKMPKRGVENR